MRLTDIAQAWLKETLEPGDTVIDATLGNGFDALFLAQSIGESGELFGFDVQESAIIQTEQRLQEEPCSKTFFLQGHEHMLATLPPQTQGEIKVIMFNLGWLPNSDKSIITRAKTTIQALEQSLKLLSNKGRLSVMVYPGHQGGDDEAEQVITWLEQTCNQSNTHTFKKVSVPQRPTAPILLQIQKDTEPR